MNRERIYLFDTTLRDGLQTPGIDFSLEDKLVVMGLLDQLGVDYIEGGYPGGNPTDTALFAADRKTSATFTAQVASDVRTIVWTSGPESTSSQPAIAAAAVPVVAEATARVESERESTGTSHSAEGAFLAGARLGGAKLDGAKLGGAFLLGADLRNADLRNADLTGAFMPFADLYNADLRNADLTGAFMPFANGAESNLAGLQLPGAFMPFTRFQGHKMQPA